VERGQTKKEGSWLVVDTLELNENMNKILFLFGIYFLLNFYLRPCHMTQFYRDARCVGRFKAKIKDFNNEIHCMRESVKL
jgi:hypothetical protein